MKDKRPSYGSSHYTNISLMLRRNFDILLEEKKARELHERAWCEIGSGLPDPVQCRLTLSISGTICS